MTCAPRSRHSSASSARRRMSDRAPIAVNAYDLRFWFVEDVDEDMAHCLGCGNRGRFPQRGEAPIIGVYG
jgi:hypothetical protein